MKERSAFAIYLTLSFLMLCVPKSSFAEPLEVSGYASVDTRFFLRSPRYTSQKNGPEVSLVTNPEISYQTGEHEFVFAPFYRKDSRDRERTHFDLRKAYWKYDNDSWSILAGIGQVSWDITTSNHLINIINQVDVVEDIVTGDYRLGQPMVNLTKYNSWGQLDLYVLPGFRERTFAGRNGRIRHPLPVDVDNPIYESSAEEKHVDFAGRYSHSVNGWDASLYYFHGTGRDPSSALNSTGTALLPIYSIINQVGTGLRYTNNGWCWKFEGIVREGQGKTLEAYVTGVDYTFNEALGSKASLGLMAEYAFDNRELEAGFTAFDENAFAGFWIGFNDERKSLITATANVDKDSHEILFNIQASTYVTDSVQIEFLGRAFSNARIDDEIYPAEKDDYIQFRLIQNF